MVAENSPYIPLADVPELPSLRMIKSRRKISVPTVVRWWRHGIKSVSGQRVFLRAMKVGGLPVTTEEWLAEFFAALAASAESPSVISIPQSSMRQRSERAQKRLKRHRM